MKTTTEFETTDYVEKSSENIITDINDICAKLNSEYWPTDFGSMIKINHDWVDKFMVRNYNDSYVFFDPILKILNDKIDWKKILLENNWEKYIWVMHIEKWAMTMYELKGDVLKLPHRVYAEDEAGKQVNILPYKEDFLGRVKESMLIKDCSLAKRMEKEKEIMWQFIELAKINYSYAVKEWDLKLKECADKYSALWIKVELVDDYIDINLPWRIIQDNNGSWEWLTPPLNIKIDLNASHIDSYAWKVRWAFSHNIGWHPCFGNIESTMKGLLKELNFDSLIDMTIKWAMSFNSQDTGVSEGSRHPREQVIAVLRDKYLYDNNYDWFETTEEDIEKFRDKIKEMFSREDFERRCPKLAEIFYPETTEENENNWATE